MIIYTIEQAAKVLKISPWKIKQLLKSGFFPKPLTPGKYIWRRIDLINFLEAFLDMQMDEYLEKDAVLQTLKAAESAEIFGPIEETDEFGGEDGDSRPPQRNLELNLKAPRSFSNG